MASGSQKHGFDESRFEKAVSRNFICSVCLCVLKHPKTCPNNEHAFCSDCITEHLKHSSTCPECADPLTVETLKRPQRLFLNCLSELTIKCDHFTRGCRQYVQLEELPRHAINCDFAPVLCSNQDCGMEINKRDKIYHETHVCEYRHKCHDCTEIRRGTDETKINMADMKRDVSELKKNMAELKTDLAELKTEMVESRVKVKTDLDEIKVNMFEINAKVKADLTKVTTDLAEVKTNFNELLKEFRATTGEMLKTMNAIQSLPHVTPAAELQDIIIAGGWESYHMLSSVERFSWQTRSWAPLPPIKQPRVSATSFVYKNQIFVVGGFANGFVTDSVEMMNIHGEAVQWQTFPAKLPIKVCSHTTVVYQNRLIVVGGWHQTHDKLSDAIYEVLLTSPYSTKLLRRMPEARNCHGTELVNDKLFILGGNTGNGVTDSVLMYDIARNECKQMPSLPYAVEDMSTVSWRDKVILLGGCDENDRFLNDVVMYDTVTGETEVLPPMKHKSLGSSAVVTGDRIIIMGGYNGKDYLNSVECYSFSSNSWQELPPMINRRQWATAVVKPVNIY